MIPWKKFQQINKIKIVPNLRRKTFHLEKIFLPGNFWVSKLRSNIDENIFGFQRWDSVQEKNSTRQVWDNNFRQTMHQYKLYIWDKIVGKSSMISKDNQEISK